VAGRKKTPGPPRKTGGSAGAAPRASPARALPDPAGDAPLEELSRDALSVLLYVWLLPEEARALVKELRLSVPGFRTDALGDVELCDVLADEIRGAPATRAKVVERLRAVFGGMPLPDVPLDPAAADDLLELGSSEHGLTYALWRVLADPDAAVRGRATPVLEKLVAKYYGPFPEGTRAPPRKDEDPQETIAALERKLADREKELDKEREEGRARVESARKKGEEQREKLQAWLKDARAREAQAVEEAARAREAADAAAKARERAEAALAQAQATDAAAEAQRARATARDLEGKVAALEARLARQAERERELQAAADAAQAARARNEAERPAAQAAPEADEPEDAPAAWLMPVYTREFYDSLEGWDRRIQRAAFKQANLLAQDHRHGSLRALPLEGLPGYYRVRVATDVRLLYRRTERQNTIEILSLIDREDLDRYVRQAKTRAT
jgi:mRNA-degrading endonuclease RelE of RelBE toxin-antitoxin system